MQKILDLIAFELTKLKKDLKQASSAIRQAKWTQNECTLRVLRIERRIAQYETLSNIVKQDIKKEQ